MNFTKIKETCIYISDLERAKAFYHGVLELSIIHYVKGKHLFLRAGHSVLLLFNPEDSRKNKKSPPHFGGGNQHFAFEVPLSDYEKTKEEIKSKGIKITNEVIWTSGKESFYFEDPEGNVLEIIPDEGIWD
jgi:catechol-2,3-dioxygenase